MSEIAERLAINILENEIFLSDYRKLLISAFSNTAERLSIEEIKRLVEAAAIFISSSEEKKVTGYRILVLLLEKYSQDFEGLQKIVQRLLISMGNFPDVKLCIEKAKDHYATYDKSIDVCASVSNLDVIVKQFENLIRLSVKKEYFTNFQLKVYTALLENKSISYSAPTSTGKSFLLKHYLVHRFLNTNKLTVVYIVPSRALISQVQRDMRISFREFQVKDVHVFTSNPWVIDESVKLPEKKLLVLTQERFASFLFEKKNNETIDIFIVDEAQNLGKGSRGILLESVIAESIKRNPEMQKIFLTPFTSNPKKLLEIFGEENSDVETTRESPVCQNYFRVITKGKTARVNLILPSEMKPIFLYENDFPKVQKNHEKKVWLARSFASESNIIYCNGPADCRNVAAELSQREPLKEKDSEITEAMTFLSELIHKDYSLIEYLPKGIAIHHGKIPTTARHLIEDLFKRKKIKYLCCTSTLLEGVNLPAKCVFIYDPKLGKIPLDRLGFRNLAGRAGRLLKDFYGNVYCLNEDEWANGIDLEKLDENKIESSVESILISRKNEIIEYLKSAYLGKKIMDRPAIETLVTKFVIQRMKDGDDSFIKQLLSRNTGLDVVNLSEIDKEIKRICSEIKLPVEVLEKNSDIDPRIQNSLYIDIQKGKVLPPPFPQENEFYDKLLKLFHVFRVYFENADEKEKTSRYVTQLAVKWIKEKSLNEIIQSNITYEMKKRQITDRKKDRLNRIIDKTIDDIEQLIRYQYARYMKCYITLKKHSLESQGNTTEKIAEKLPIYMEYGAYRPLTLMLQAMGVSRSVAIQLSTKLQNRTNIKDPVQLLGYIKDNFDDVSIGLSKFSKKELNDELGI